MSTKNGSSKSTSTPRSSSVPKRNLEKRIHQQSSHSRLEDASSGHSCTARFTELVSCNRGYGSVALYAVFSIFIVAFVYVIWKILSAHISRSGNTRRPGSTNSTAAPKMTSTTHSLSGNVTSLRWMQQGHGRKIVGHVVHNARPQKSKVRGPEKLKIHLADESKSGKIESISNANTPPWLISRSTTGPPTSLPTSKQEPSRNSVPNDWSIKPATREPTVVRSTSVPVDYNYFFRPNRENYFLKDREITAGIGRPKDDISDKEITAGIGRPMDVMSDYDDSRKPDWLKWEAKKMHTTSVPYEDLSTPGPYRYYKNQIIQDGYDLSYHGDDGNTEIPHNPRPTFPSVFDGDSQSPSNTMRPEYKERLPSRTREKPAENHHHRYLLRHRKHHGRHGSLYETENVRSNDDHDGDHVEREPLRTEHRTAGHHKYNDHHYWPRVRGFHRLIHHRHENTYRLRQAHRHRHHGYKNREQHQTESKEIHRKVWKSQHTRRPVHRLAKQVSRSKLNRHRKQGSRHYSRRVPKHTIPKRSKPTHRSVQPRRHPRLHVLGYRRYLQYRRHHSFQEESRGKWRKSRHRVRTCKTLHTFSTAGTVKLSRRKYKNKFLYTLLVCQPVRFRIHRHRRKSEVRRAQICRNKWYVTRGLIRVKKTTETPAFPSYSVRLCAPSFPRMMRPSFGEARHKSRKGARKLPAKHQRHHVKKAKHHQRKTRKKKGKKTVARKHLAKRKELAKKQKKTKRLRYKSRKKHHIHILSKSRKTKETGKKSGVSMKDFIHHNHSRKRGKKLNVAKAGSRNDFFVKLLQVLKLAKQNQTAHRDVFGSLENAVERIIQKHGTHHKNATRNVGKFSKNSRSHVHSKPTSIAQGKLLNVSEGFIQSVLTKVLPYVLQSMKSNGSSQVMSTVATAKTAKPTTKPKPTTNTKSTHTPKPTTKTPTVKPSGVNMEAVLRNILPLLVKGAHQTRATQATTTKPITAIITPAPTQSKNKKIKDLLASLGLGALDLGSLENLNMKTTKPTQKVDKVLDTTRLTSTAKPTTRIPWTPDVLLPSTRKAIPPPPLPPTLPPPTPYPFLPARPVKAPTAMIPNQNVGRNADPFTKHILCFGDSLTGGFYNHGRNYHPYSIRLNQLLNSNGRGTHFDVDTSGEVREMVHGSMTKRLPVVLGNTSHVDWAIILGGTNDVAHVKNFGDDDSFMNQLINVWKPKIVQDILSLHQTAYRFGARTVLLTIPESAYEAWPNFKTLWVMRTAINRDLRAFAQRSQGRTVLCDLAIKLPRHSLPAKAQALLWNDHLHPTPYGYDRMADIVYQCMKPYLRK